MIVLAELYWVLILVVTTFNKPEASEKLRKLWNVSIIKIRVVNTDKSPIPGESSMFLIVIANQLFAVNFSFLLAHLFWVLAYLAWGRLSMLQCHISIPHLHPTSCCNRLSEDLCHGHQSPPQSSGKWAKALSSDSPLSWPGCTYNVTTNLLHMLSAEELNLHQRGPKRKWTWLTASTLLGAHWDGSGPCQVRTAWDFLTKCHILTASSWAMLIEPVLVHILGKDDMMYNSTGHIWQAVRWIKNVVIERRDIETTDLTITTRMSWHLANQSETGESMIESN